MDLEGPNSHTIRYGVPLDFEHSPVKEAIDRAAGAAARHAKRWMLNRGGRMFTAGGDRFSLGKGLRESFAAYGSVAIGS